MSFLDRIGKACFAGLRYAAPFFGTLAQAEVGTPLQTIGGLVLAAEAIGEQVQQSNGTKLDKLKLVLPEAMAALKASPLLEGKEVQDQAGFESATAGIVNGVVQLLSSVDLKAAATPAPANSQAAAAAPAAPAPQA